MGVWRGGPTWPKAQHLPTVSTVGTRIQLRFRSTEPRPWLKDPSLGGWSALALFSALFTISDSFLAGHVPILIIVTGYLFGRNPHLWRQAQEFDVSRADHYEAVHKRRHHRDIVKTSGL